MCQLLQLLRIVLSDDSDLIQNICPDLLYRVRQRKSLPRATDRLRLLQQIFNKGIYSLEDLEILDRCNFHPEWDKQDLDVVLLDDNAWADKYWAPEFIVVYFQHKSYSTLFCLM